MIDKIFDGISVALHAAFGKGTRILGDEDIEQGLTPPCFFVSLVSAGRTYNLGPRYRDAYRFDVRYFPERDGDHAEMREVGNKLFESLERIALADGNTLRGQGMTYQIVDGVLHFMIRYACFLRREADQTAMEDASLVTGLTEG